MSRSNAENEVSEQRIETVKRLLQKLPESERTVVILYYLGEMTAKGNRQFFRCIRKYD